MRTRVATTLPASADAESARNHAEVAVPFRTKSKNLRPADEKASRTRRGAKSTRMIGGRATEVPGTAPRIVTVVSPTTKARARTNMTREYRRLGYRGRYRHATRRRATITRPRS